MKIHLLPPTLLLLFLSSALAQETKPAKPPANPAPNFLLVDCISWHATKLTCKVRQEKHFKTYIASNVSYRRNEQGLHGNLDHVAPGETYIITFEQTGNAPLTHIKSATLINPQNPPQEIPDESLIAKIIEIKDKDAAGKPVSPENVFVVVHFTNDDNVKKFFNKERFFDTYPDKHDFAAGQVIMIPMELDNRHCKNAQFAVVKDPPAKQNP